MEQLTQTVLPQSVVVGVTGRGENTDALVFAVREARTLGSGVTLVHALHPLILPPPPDLVTGDMWSDVAGEIVAGVSSELGELLGDAPVPVATLLRSGDPGAVLSEVSKQARLVVLQHRSLSRLRRIVTGSTVASVAAHSHCPVISVPRAAGDRPSTRVVTAGVHGDGGPRPVLETAFAEAEVRDASLRVVYSWRLDAAYDDIIARDDRWTVRDEECITEALSDLTVKYPKVTVAVEVRHAWPADTLVLAARESDLLVIGRHKGLPATPHRLGSMARAVVAHADCPVMIVPV